MHLLIKFQELVKVHFKEERTEAKNLEKYGGEMWTKTGLKSNSKKNFVYANVNLVIEWVSLDLLFEKTPTNLFLIQYNQRSNGTEIYRLAHSCSYAVISDQIVISRTLVIEALNHVIKEFVTHFYTSKCRIMKGFIQNYEFPCVGTWGRFHVYISSKLKNLKFNKLKT